MFFSVYFSTRVPIPAKMEPIVDAGPISWGVRDVKQFAILPASYSIDPLGPKGCVFELGVEVNGGTAFFYIPSEDVEGLLSIVYQA